MNTSDCIRDHDIATAAIRQNLSGDMNAHVAGCAACARTVLLVDGLREVAQHTRNTLGSIPSSRGLWLRAQFSRRQQAMSHLDRLLLGGAIALAGVLALAIIVWKWDPLRLLPGPASTGLMSSLPAIAIAGCIGLVWFLTEEVFRRDG